MPGQAIQTVTLGPRAESPEQAAEWLPLDARVKPEHDGVGGWRARAGRLGARRLVPALGGEGEDLVAGGGDADGMLELGRGLHVAGDGGPAVPQDKRKRVVWGRGVIVCVNLGGRGFHKKKQNTRSTIR